MPSPTQAGAGALPGGRSRRSTAVDEYVGLPATEAIEAARAAGLRPAPERAEASEHGQHGIVLAQEPVAGSPAPPDGLLTLCVAEETPEVAANNEDFATDPTAAVDLAAEETPPDEWELDDLDAGPAEEPLFAPSAAPTEPVCDQPPVDTASSSRAKRRARWGVRAAVGLATVLALFAAAALSSRRATQPNSQAATETMRTPVPSPGPRERMRAARPHRSLASSRHRTPRRPSRARNEPRPVKPRTPAHRAMPLGHDFIVPPRSQNPERDEFF